VDKIDEVLLDWYEWTQAYSPALGHGKADAACRDFRISRQWMDYDDLNEEVERKLKEAIGKIVEPMVQKLDIRGRLALNTAMMNFGAGATVWVNPRHADTQETDYARVKVILCPQLALAGLIEKDDCKLRERVA
jgi:hypothetical protein